MSKLPEHSPLGASGAHRWMRCPGSVKMSQGVGDPESDFAAEGTKAHEIGSICLGSGVDAWQLIGTTGIAGVPGEVMETFSCDKDMADAVQVYLDAARSQHDFEWHLGENVWIEHFFHCPSIHELFFGRSDLVALEGDTLHIWDYKHGAGIVVEVEWNPQLMYYAAGVLESLGLWNKIPEVTLHVAQPRGFHMDGPVREWTVSTAQLWAWLYTVLVPAMDRALASDETNSGEHCRFCPARRHACPQLLADADELEEYLKMMEEGGGAKALSNEQVGRFLDLCEVIKIAGKAARETGYARVEKGGAIPGWKLAKARSFREWKDGAEEAIIREFGKDKAYTDPKLKSPADVDKMPRGRDFTAKHAFKPDNGLQLVRDSDSRPEAGPKAKSMFKPTGKKGKKK